MLNIISLVVAIIGVVGLLFSLRQAYRARLRQFEEKYVERYWSILDSLSLAALSISDQLPDHDDEMTIRKYIFLCEDELQMRKNGYISDETYYEWADGMLDQLKQPMFKEVWDRIQDEANQHKRGVFAYENLRNLLDATTEKGAWDIEALEASGSAEAARDGAHDTWPERYHRRLSCHNQLPRARALQFAEQLVHRGQKLRTPI